MRKKKEKKANDISFKRVISNFSYSFKLLYSTGKSRIWVAIINSLVGTFLGFLTGTYLTRYIVNSLQLGREFSQVIVFTLSCLGAQIIYNLLMFAYNNFALPLISVNTDLKLKQAFFKKASEEDLSCFEDPEFYNKYTKALPEAVGATQYSLNLITSILSTAISLIMNTALIF